MSDKEMRKIQIFINKNIEELKIIDISSYTNPINQLDYLVSHNITKNIIKDE
jgi:hypothetical protein